MNEYVNGYESRKKKNMPYGITFIDNQFQTGYKNTPKKLLLKNCSKD